MHRYVYAFRREAEDGEVFFRFPRFPEIIFALDRDTLRTKSQEDIAVDAHDAVITALQAIIVTREEVPAGDDTALVQADGFVHLSVRESMKLELYKLYKENAGSIADFARSLGKSETAARRLLDLRHSSRSSEIEKAVAVFGKRLAHDWALEKAA